MITTRGSWNWFVDVCRNETCGRGYTRMRMVYATWQGRESVEATQSALLVVGGHFSIYPQQAVIAATGCM